MKPSLARFTGQNRYLLEIHHGSIKADVLRFRGREALSEPFCWNIEFTSVQDVSDTDVLMKFASFILRSGKQVHGIVTGFDWLSGSVDQSHYRLRLESRLALLSRTRRCRIFQNLSAPELVEQVLREHGYEGADFEFRLAQNFPVRELITQWRETDLAFVQRVLAEVGIWFRSETNADTETETLIFGDGPQAYAAEITLPYREPAGLEDGQSSVWGLRSRNHVTTGSVAMRDYHYRQAALPADARASVQQANPVTGEHYHYLAPYREADDEAASAETESGAFYARLNHERELNRAATLHLFSNDPDVSPGAVLETRGNDCTALSGGAVIRLTTWRGARDTRLHVSLWGIPWHEHYGIRTTVPQRPVISGTVPARVESRDASDIYGWLDEQGRYRVRLDVMRGDTESGYSYLWLRQAKPYAGETCGWHTPLVQGTEVAIGFDGGDPDRPYIAHAFHDSEHADVTVRDNRSQNILRTPAGNEVRMEDKRGAEHLSASTEFARTQLNQGQITDAQEKPRGSGFELRTDEHGVIRVAKGLFISADGQRKAAGEVLERETVLREIDLCLQQIEQLKMAAAQAQALSADVESQRRMFAERLQPLNQLLHLSAPEGVALASGEHLQLTAAENIALNASGSLSAGAMGDISLMAGERAGLFARSGRLSMIAGQGVLTVQAQNAAMRLTAGKKVRISAEQDALFAGKKRVVLIGGGSYLKLEAGKIEYGTQARYLRKVKTTMKATSRPQEPALTEMIDPLPDISCGPFAACFHLTDLNSESKDIPFAWKITTKSGVIEGKTENAVTNLVKTNQEESLSLDYLFQTKAGIR